MGLQLPWIGEPMGLQKPVDSQLVFRWLPVGFPVGLSLVSCWFFVKYPLVPVGFEVKGFIFTYIGRMKTQEKSLKNQFYVSLSLDY
jgi:hypothetical protein